MRHNKIAKMIIKLTDKNEKCIINISDSIGTFPDDKG